MKKVVLAYSGGLDTSIILKWLLEKGYEVICFLADVGQKEDFKAARVKAEQIGASKVIIQDLKNEFLEKYIFKALQANARYEGRYLLGTALSRPLIAQKQVELALKEKAQCVAHGATGKGNDQIRFELVYHMHNLSIISPWKDPEFFTQFQGREEMIDYAEKMGIPITSSKKKPYSMDENLMHCSYEGGLLENPAESPPEDMFRHTSSMDKMPHEPSILSIRFKHGIPVSLFDSSTSKSPLQLFQYLNAVASLHGIGREDIVENRCIGMKSRGVYESPAATVLWKAHEDLESLVLDREVLHLKQMWTHEISKLIYNGLWFSPEMEFLMAGVEKSQERVEGKVTLRLYKGNVHILSRTSPHSLYNQDIASMSRLGNYDQSDAKGFIKLQALRLRSHYETVG